MCVPTDPGSKFMIYDLGKGKKARETSEDAYFKSVHRPTEWCRLQGMTKIACPLPTMNKNTVARQDMIEKDCARNILDGSSIWQEQKSFQRCPLEGGVLPYSMQQHTEVYASYSWQGNVVHYIFKSIINWMIIISYSSWIIRSKICELSAQI